MVQPAGDLLNEISEMGGERRFILGRDRRGYIDIFIYCAKKDKVFQIKVEEIRPRQAAGFSGYDIEGFGDEIDASDELIERILERGRIMTKKDEFEERLHKYGTQVMPVGAMNVEGPSNLFYALEHDNPDFMKQVKGVSPKKVDGRLSRELERHLLKQKLGSSNYIW